MSLDQTRAEMETIAVRLEQQYPAVLSVLTGVLFGLAPAWQASRPDVHETLKQTTRGVTGGRDSARLWSSAKSR